MSDDVQPRKSFIYEITLQQADDDYAPPASPVLVLSLIGRDLFITAMEHEETNSTITRKVKASYVVRYEEIANAINALARAAR